MNDSKDSTGWWLARTNWNGWMLATATGGLLAGLVFGLTYTTMPSAGLIAFQFWLATSGWMMVGWYRTSARRAERELTAVHQAYLAGTGAFTRPADAPALPAANENASGGPYRALPEVAAPIKDDTDEIARELRKLDEPLTVEDVVYIDAYERWDGTGTGPTPPVDTGVRAKLWRNRLLPTLWAVVGPELFRKRKAERVAQLQAELNELTKETT